MPSDKSHRVSVSKAVRNRVVKSAARTAVTAARQSLAGANQDEVQLAVAHAASAVDRAAGHGAIHRNSASRRKARLARKLRPATE